MTLQQLLAQLQDIEVPEGVRALPLAAGWYGLLLVAVGGVALAWYFRRYFRRRRPLVWGRTRLDAIQHQYEKHRDGTRCLRELSIVLRRLSLEYYPRHDVAPLVGEAWLKFLDQGMNGQPFQQGCGRDLLHGPYRVDPKYDPTEVLKLGRQKINAFRRIRT